MTLFMMLDTSGSMGYGDGYNDRNGANDASSFVQDYNICSWSSSGSRGRGVSRPDVRSESRNYQVATRNSKTYNVNVCYVDQSSFNRLSATYRSRIQTECEPNSASNAFPYRCYDRLSRLKMALVQALTGNEIADSTRLGLGQFSSPTDNTAYSHDSRSGRIVYPVVILTPSNREILLDYIVKLNAFNGTPSAAAYAEAAAYLLGANLSNGRWGLLTYSGYDYSIASAKSANYGQYNAALTAEDTQNTCNGNGVYFLTDGFANNSDARSTQALMNRTLPLSGTGLSGGTSNAGWNEIGQFSRLLRTQKNIKTAVVGFGSSFPNTSDYVQRLTNSKGIQTPYYDCSKLSGQDLVNTCNWGAKDRSDIAAADKHKLSTTVGGFGNGGFYSAQSVDDLVNSIVNFVADIQPDLPPLAIGAPTIPVDNLNAIESRPHGYYAAFVTRPATTLSLWLGNLNKYDIFNGQLGAGTTANNFRRLIKEDRSIDNSVDGLWTGGVHQQLPLGTASSGRAKRKVFTNRAVNAHGAVTSAESLQQVDLDSLFSGESEQAYFNLDPLKNYWLNLLGYQVNKAAQIQQVSQLPTLETRQLGAVMHSSPILLTQQGKIVIQNGKATSTSRKDYLLFGSTQGVVHVVDDDGAEVLAFVPHEMAEKQHDGFLVEGNTSGGKNNLYYGIDAPWAAFSQYVRKSDGTYTVAKSSRTIDDDEVESSGLQWVYGGMRMGGRSYYALDLSDIDKPSLKFHINPDAAAANNALSFMGQSWSKPTLAYVNWGGEKTLVMFVGGGYDAGYENPAYDQQNKKGAGVYMFNANSGELLWWASANATADMGAEQHTQADDLQYSVVSQINALDRDSDGLVDNLYFGDLAGQVFRIDLNNAALGASASAKKNRFATRVTRLHDAHENNGLSPRFYEMPSFTAHRGDSGLYGVVALSSGNRSSPLAGRSGKNANNTVSAEDALFVLFDNDVGRIDLYETSFVATALTGGFKHNDNLVGVSHKEGDVYNAGWSYRYSAGNNGQNKGLGELFAVDSMLYVNVYARDGDGVGGDCGASVKGDSYVYQFCLPTGKCDFYPAGLSNVPNTAKLGAGVLGAGFGQDYSNSGGGGLVIPRSNSLECSSNPNSPECQRFSTSVGMQQLRWYEPR